MDRTLLALGCLIYLAAAGRALYALGQRRLEGGWIGPGLIGLAFALQTGGLFLRSVQSGICPVTNVFEILNFISWSVALNYLVLGTLFRVSLLGALTAPLAGGLALIALLFPELERPRPIPPMTFELEMHIGLSLIAYGTLGLAAAAGIVFLITNRMLKTRTGPERLQPVPPVGALDRVCWRVALLGWLLLSAGLMFGFLVPEPAVVDRLKLYWGMFIWGAYGFVLAGRWLAKMGPTRFAWSAIGMFAFLLITFWGVHHFGRVYALELP
ncbi:MAG: cytochrome c biogenesis protein CcsA [Verrucomicrobiia bacterium]